MSEQIENVVEDNATKENCFGLEDYNSSIAPSSPSSEEINTRAKTTALKLAEEFNPQRGDQLFVVIVKPSPTAEDSDAIDAGVMIHGDGRGLSYAISKLLVAAR